MTEMPDTRRPDPFSNEVWATACKHFDTMERSQEIPMLCRAILSERERCAKIADYFYIRFGIENDIADKIRQGSPE